MARLDWLQRLRPRRFPRRSHARFNRIARRWLFAGLSGLLALYLFTLLFDMEPFLIRTELGLFQWLDGHLGKDSVLDWTVLVGASRFWVYVSLSVVLFAASAQGWAMRRRDYGQVFGLIFFAAVVTILAEEVGDFVSDHINRDLPWDSGALETIRDRYDADFLDIPSTGGIVDENMVGWGVMILLLSLRLPRPAWIALALGLVHAGARLTVGAQWLFDEVNSALLSLTLAGGALLGLGRALRWCERNASEQIILLTGFHLAPPEAGHAAVRAELTHNVAEARRLHRLRRHRFWENLTRRSVLPVLNATGRPATLAAQPPGRTIPGFRPSPHVRFLALEGGELFVIRAMRRWGGWLAPSAKFRRYVQSARCHLYLERLGLPVPRMFWVRETLTTLGLRNLYFLVEEFIDGRPVDRDSQAELRAAVGLLVRLHGFESETWGPVAQAAPQPRSHYLLRALRPDLLYYLRRIEKWADVRFDHDDLERLWKLEEAAALAVLLRRRRPFRLIHGDVHYRNFLYGPARGEVHLIDFTTVAYDLHGWEILKMAAAFGRREAPAAARLWREYFELAGEERWGEFLHEAPLALFRHGLREMAHQRVAPPHAPAALRKASILEWLAGLLAPAPELWGARAAETDWEALLERMRPDLCVAAGVQPPADSSVLP